MKSTYRGFWRASESEVAHALAHGWLDDTKSLVCLRRTLPSWWPWAASRFHSKMRFDHVPIPPSSSPSCESALRAFLDVLMPQLPRPVVVFCKEGRHRTGIVAAVVARRCGATAEEALLEYVLGTRGEPRESELALLERLF